MNAVARVKASRGTEDLQKERGLRKSAQDTRSYLAGAAGAHDGRNTGVARTDDQVNVRHNFHLTRATWGVAYTLCDQGVVLDMLSFVAAATSSRSGERIKSVRCDGDGATIPFVPTEGGQARCSEKPCHEDDCQIEQEKC